jgi:CheY-like chemotaxis protein
MIYPFKILIADRNRHVREFLRREFREAGYRVQAAKDGREILLMIDVSEPPDLLILDLEIPLVDGLEILDLLHGRMPPLPVVVHAFLSEHVNQPALEKASALVEKKGDPDCLKRAVREVLQSNYPDRFASAAGA